jgi:hypothetical protein
MGKSLTSLKKYYDLFDIISQVHVSSECQKDQSYSHFSINNNKLIFSQLEAILKGNSKWQGIVVCALGNLV